MYITSIVRWPIATLVFWHLFHHPTDVAFHRLRIQPDSHLFDRTLAHRTCAMILYIKFISRETSQEIRSTDWNHCPVARSIQLWWHFCLRRLHHVLFRVTTQHITLQISPGLRVVTRVKSNVPLVHEDDFIIFVLQFAL